jgi:alpha-mannosidase
MSTDSNGREMLVRKRNHRTMWNLSQTEQIAGNYYPVNTAASLVDEETGTTMTLLVDRASGVGSIEDGEIEVMLHRRILDDDGRGVGEPLNETRDVYSYAGDFGGTHSGPGLVVRGITRLTLEKASVSASIWRPLADRVYAPPLLLVRTSGGGASLFSSSHLASDVPLPLNLQLMTLQSLSTTELLVRISHQYGIGEDAKLSLPAEVDVAALLSKETFEVVSVREVSLTNSMNKSSIVEQRARNLEWNTEGKQTEPHEWRLTEMDGTTVTIGPLEIKTFVVTVNAMHT